MEWDYSVLAGYIVVVVLATNALLFGAYQALGFFKDKTESSVDNNAYELIGKILSFLKKIIEIVGPVTAVKVAADSDDKSKPG